MSGSGHSPIAARYDRSSRPCPRCECYTKGCSSTEDELHLCRGEAIDPRRWREVGRPDAAGFRHYRLIDDPPPSRNGHHRRRGDRRVADPARDFQAIAERYAGLWKPKPRESLARSLGLPVAALDALPMLGFDPDRCVALFPECDANGRVIGIATRAGKGAKKMLNGSRRGLTLPTGWRERPGPVIVVEGPTDTLAATAAGLACIGRPSNSGGVELLSELFRGWPADRDIIILGENDTKADGAWPGRDGAVAVARGLAAKLGRPVAWALPPCGYKDARETLTRLPRGGETGPETTE